MPQGLNRMKDGNGLRLPKIITVGLTYKPINIMGVQKVRIFGTCNVMHYSPEIFRF